MQRRRQVWQRERGGSAEVRRSDDGVRRPQAAREHRRSLGTFKCADIGLERAGSKLLDGFG